MFSIITSVGEEAEGTETEEVTGTEIEAAGTTEEEAKPDPEASTVFKVLAVDWSNPSWYWICSSTQPMHLADAWEPAGFILCLELVAWQGFGSPSELLWLPAQALSGCSRVFKTQWDCFQLVGPYKILLLMWMNWGICLSQLQASKYP
ncbi:hypothetical protein DSO57_1030172, partial [Entomophthora muscae]